MALTGIVGGLVGGLFATRALESTLYGVSHLDPIAYVCGAAVLLIAALLGAYVPAARSSSVDPLLAIRAD
jgi:ABC-type antimicrobial peptide transport system permease subunit